MQTRVLSDSGGRRTLVAVLEEGDEAMACLEQLARAESLSAAHLTAIGAFSRAEISFFDWEAKEYRPIKVEEQTEVATLIGDIVLGPEGEPAIHCHVVLGRSDGSALAGHLAKGRVRPTLEIMVEETPAHLRRVLDETTGLTLIDPGAAGPV